jgi:hypothetical protein
VGEGEAVGVGSGVAVGEAVGGGVVGVGLGTGEAVAGGGVSVGDGVRMSWVGEGVVTGLARELFLAHFTSTVASTSTSTISATKRTSHRLFFMREDTSCDFFVFSSL